MGKRIFLKEELLIFEAVIKWKIPNMIKDNDNNNFEYDLMECYEELFNYSYAAIDGKPIDLRLNSYGKGKSFIFNNEYKKILIELLNHNDYNIRIYCNLNLSAIYILENKLLKRD